MVTDDAEKSGTPHKGHESKKDTAAKDVDQAVAPSLALDVLPRSRPIGSLEGPRPGDAGGPSFTINTCLTLILVVVFAVMFAASVVFLRETNEEKYQRKQKEYMEALQQDRSVMRRIFAWAVLMVVGAGFLIMLLRIENSRGQPSNARYLWLILILALPVLRAIWMRKVPEVKLKLTKPAGAETLSYQTRTQKFISYLGIAVAAAIISKVWTKISNSRRLRAWLSNPRN